MEEGRPGEEVGFGRGIGDGGCSGETEGEELWEVTEGFFEVWEGERVADEGEVEMAQVVGFGEGREAVNSALCQYPSIQSSWGRILTQMTHSAQ